MGKYAIQIFHHSSGKPTKELKSVIRKVAKDFGATMDDNKQSKSLVIEFTDEFQAKKCLLRVQSEAIGSRGIFSGFVVTGFQYDPERRYLDPDKQFSEY